MGGALLSPYDVARTRRDQLIAVLVDPKATKADYIFALNGVASSQSWRGKGFGAVRLACRSRWSARQQFEIAYRDEIIAQAEAWRCSNDPN